MIILLQNAAQDAAQNTRESAQRIIRNFENIEFLSIAMVLGTAIGLIWVIHKFFPWLAKYVPTRFRLAVLGTGPILRLIVIVIATGLILHMVLRLTPQNLIVIAGAASVAIGFAFKDLVSSLIAGVVAVFERPYRPGDWVRVGGQYGEVQAMGLRSFTMVTPADDVVTVTHDRIWEDNIVNSNNGANTLMCVSDFFLLPDHDPAKVRAVLREVALTSPFLSYSHPVFVVLSEKPFATHYKVKAYPFDMRDQFRFVSDITSRGKVELRRIGAREAVAPTSFQQSEI